MITLRQASPFLWFIFVLGLLTFGFMYVMLMEPMGTVYNMFYNDSALDDQSYQTFFIRTLTIWKWLPFIVVMSSMLFIILKIHEQYVTGGQI